MIKVENISVMNIENAIRGARNPMNSWNRSDSSYNPQGEYILGENDMDLAKRLIASGTDHRKFLRQIFVSMDITAPLYWWKEMDQYRIGATTNSCSTMHKIHAKEFEPDDFSHEHLSGASIDHLEMLIDWLNGCRESYVKYKHKEDWWQMIQLLPSSYNQKRTWTGSYENLRNMHRARKGHKLDEWRDFCTILEGLPYAEDFIVERGVHEVSG